MRKLLPLGFIFFMTASSVMGVSAQEPVLRIYGEVNNPINITYSDFQMLPMVHVNSSLICVGSDADNVGVNSFVVYTYNWTGVRLSDLLEMVKPTDDAYDMVFRDDTRYSSSIHVSETERDDFILAIYADGQVLDRAQGYPFRVVVPCYWGYKWVKYVERIEITDYDHRGFWESTGYPDDGQIPGCTPDQIITNPAVFTEQSLAVITIGLVFIVFSFVYAKWG
jgi:DMSO/TMAO reductase YedYZ molybdopterin-dependent catalytic subunit